MPNLRSVLIAVIAICILLAVGTGLSLVYLRSRTQVILPTKTLPVPPTETNCPKAGTARAAITAPLMLGKHPNVIYLDNEKQGTSITTSLVYGTLQRYDILTGEKIIIMKSLYMQFITAQISQDGQWIIFVSEKFTNKGILDELRMIRMDGQGLQTLYCVSSSTRAIFPQLAWSPDQNTLAFTVIDWNESGTEIWHVYLLDLTSGKLKPALAPQINPIQPVTPIYYASKWLDNTYLYVTSLYEDPEPIQSEHILYLLDTNDGSNQHIDNLQIVTALSNTQRCFDYDISTDGTKMFNTQCYELIGIPDGLSQIKVQSASSYDYPTIIYSSTMLFLTKIRVANATTLLFLSKSIDNEVDLWRINTDGSNITHLMTGELGDAESGEPWVSISRDGGMYATDVSDYQSKTVRLVFASLDGSTPTTILSSTASENSSCAVIGWTTM